MNYMINYIIEKFTNYFSPKTICNNIPNNEYYLPQILNLVEDTSELTYDTCIDRVKQNGALIVYIPKRFIDLNICIIAMGNKIFKADNHTYNKLINNTQIRKYGFSIERTDPNKSIMDEYKLYLPENRCMGNICLYNNPKCCESVKYKCRLTYEMNDVMRQKYIVDKNMRKMYREYFGKLKFC